MRVNFRSHLNSVSEKLLLKSLGLSSISIQLDLTNACNLACSHCYHPHHSNAGALSLANWSKILDEYEKLLGFMNARPNIAICGGEPLLSPNLYPILNQVVKKWPSAFVGIMTNGTQIKRHIARLEQYPLYFQVSLESNIADEHDAIRGSGSFAATMEGVRLLQERFFDVHLSVIISALTAPQIDQMFAFAKSAGFKSLNYIRAIPQGAGKKYFAGSKDASLNDVELRRALGCIVQSSRIHGVVTNTDKPLFALVDGNLGRSGSAGFQGLVVSYNGKLKASSRCDLVLGDVLEDGLANLFFNNGILKSLRAGQVAGCSNCSLNQKCGGDRSYAYATTGDFLGMDRGCWKLNMSANN